MRFSFYLFDVAEIKHAKVPFNQAKPRAETTSNKCLERNQYWTKILIEDGNGTTQNLRAIFSLTVVKALISCQKTKQSEKKSEETH